MTRTWEARLKKGQDEAAADRQRLYERLRVLEGQGRIGKSKRLAWQKQHEEEHDKDLDKLHCSFRRIARDVTQVREEVRDVKREIQASREEIQRTRWFVQTIFWEKGIDKRMHEIEEKLQETQLQWQLQLQQQQQQKKLEEWQ